MTNPALAQAWSAFQQGRRDEAKSSLLGLLRTNPQSVPAWLLLSEVVDQPQQQRDCLQRVLALDPTNQRAKQLMAAFEAPVAPPIVEIPAPTLTLSSGDSATMPLFTPPVVGATPTPNKQTDQKDFKLPWEEYSEIQPQPTQAAWPPQTAPQMAAWPPQEPQHAAPIGYPQAPFPQQGQAQWGNAAPFPFPTAQPKQSAGYGKIILAFLITVVVTSGLLFGLNLMGKPTNKATTAPRPAVAADLRVKNFLNSLMESIRDPRFGTPDGNKAIATELANAYIYPDDRSSFIRDYQITLGLEAMQSGDLEQIQQFIKKISMTGDIRVIEDNGQEASVSTKNLKMTMTLIDNTSHSEPFDNNEFDTFELSNVNGVWYIYNQ